MLYSSVAEVAQKGIPGSQREERQGWTLTITCLRVEPVDNLVGCAVAADGDELADALAVSLARNTLRIARCACLGDLDLKSARSQALESWGQKPAALAAPHRWIYDGQKRLSHASVCCWNRCQRQLPLNLFVTSQTIRPSATFCACITTLRPSSVLPIYRLPLPMPGVCLSATQPAENLCPRSDIRPRV